MQNCAERTSPCPVRMRGANVSASRPCLKDVYDILQQSPATDGSFVREASDESSGASTREYGL